MRSHDTSTGDEVSVIMHSGCTLIRPVCFLCDFYLILLFGCAVMDGHLSCADVIFSRVKIHSSRCTLQAEF